MRKLAWFVVWVLLWYLPAWAVDLVTVKERSVTQLADGVYEIRHPELVLLSVASAIIAFPDPDHPGLNRSWEIVSLRHMVRLERIETASQTS